MGVSDTTVREKNRSRRSSKAGNRNQQDVQRRPKRDVENGSFFQLIYVLFVILLLSYVKYNSNNYNMINVQLHQRQRQHQQRLLKEKNTDHSSHRISSQPTNTIPIVDYLELPTLRWMNVLPSGEEFLQGNAIQVSPFDESVLYATSQTGNLLVLSAVTGETIETIRPLPRKITENGSTSIWSTYSNSGLAFGSTSRPYQNKDGEEEDNNNVKNGYNEYIDYILNGGDIQLENKNKVDQEQLQFVVYSIIDQPPNKSRFLPKTRVVCVKIPEHRILWTSAGLPGTSNGSPVVYHSLPMNINNKESAYDTLSTSSNRIGGGSNDDDDSDGGTYIVLTHNSVLVRPDNTSRTTGHITALETLDGHVKWTQSEWSRDEIPKGYGSPALSRNPIHGGESSGGSRDNQNDVIVWTSSDQQGRGRAGNLFAFQIASFINRQQHMTINITNTVPTTTYDPFETRVLKRVRWNSIARPVMNRNGTNLYAAVTGNAVRGWSGVARFNETADWSKKLVPTAPGTNSLLAYSDDVAMKTAPVLSTDEERLFVVTARNETVCLDSRTGERMWSATTRNASPLLAEPKASPDDERLYVIMSRDGRVVGIDQRTGKILWGFGCGGDLLSSVCGKTSVHADFDVSSDGQHLYYGDATGRIISLTVGTISDEAKNSVGPSASSSSSTTLISDLNKNTKMETNVDSYGFSSTSNTMSVGDDDKSGSGTKGGLVVIALFLSVSLFGGSAIYVMKSKGLDPAEFVSKINWQDCGIIQGIIRSPEDSSSADDANGRPDISSVLPDKNSIEDGPDMYEDKILAKISYSNKYVDTADTLWVDPTHSERITGNDDSLHRAADRMAVLLGTSNRIAPISENFGYGQAIII